ncbi:MAG: hypothetical protein ACM31C_00450 [Acidobacteriota bacterium]
MKSVLAVVAIACTACGDSSPSTVVYMDVSDVPPAYGRAPFPTDALRDGDHLGAIAGLQHVAGGNTDLIAAHLAALDGWGLRPAIEFFLSDAIDPSTLADGAVVVIDPDTLAEVQFDWQWEADRHVIAGAPHAGVQLAEGKTYAAVLTTDVRAADGSRLYAPGLGALADAPARWQSTARVYDELAHDYPLGGRIAGLAVFTTQHASDVLVAARGALATAPAPTLAFADPSIVFDSPARLDQLLGQAQRDTAGPRAGLEIWGLDNPTGYAHDHVAVVATGTTTIARFKRAATGTFGPEDKTFDVGADGVPVVQSIDTIPITVILPIAAMPATGYPVVIFGHGLGGSRADALALAEPLAAQGWAIVAIDMWGHGSRFDATDNANNFGSGKDAFTGDKTLRDGFGDNTGYAEYIAFFENFLGISAVRDTIRQSTLDFARVAMLVQRQPDLSALAGAYGGAVPKLDPTRVAYLGNSFGTLVGADLSAIEPSIDLYVLNVCGGGVLDQIVPNSAEIGTLALPVAQAIYRTNGNLDRFHPLIAMMQAMLDGGDSLTFAPHVLADRFSIAGTPLSPRHVVLIEAIGDEIMANAGTAALARAYGVGVLEPDLAPPAGLPELPSPAGGNVAGQTAVLVQYSPATHGYNWSAQHGQLAYQPGFPFPGDDPFPKLATPITIEEPIYETLAQVTHLLATHFAGGTPEVVTTATPVPLQ